MRHLPGLVPYALASAAVVVASAIALGATIRGPADLGIASIASAEPTAAGTRATLSDTGRMAYWRTGANGQLELWVSDLDGGRRWTVATASSGSDVALTRWSPDGSAVAYVVSGQQLAISRLDGATAYLLIPNELITGRWRIVSYEWSPDSTRIAASLRAANGLSNVSDAYLVNARAGSVWRRLTTLGDAFAGKWATATQLFIEEASGAVLVLDLESNVLRPLTGMPVTSPQVLRDGRVYFVGGEVVVSDVTAQPVGNGWIWSATLDGDDLRKEVTLTRDNLRLFGLLADGRPVVGVPGGVYIVGDTYVPLSFQAGTVRRVIVSADGRRALGVTDQRILLIDPAKIPRSQQALPPADAASVLLSSVREADVWFPAKSVTPVRGSARVPETAPKARLAFTLGKAMYLSDADGSVRAVATEQAGNIVGVPRWSPQGDRIIAPATLGSLTTSVVLVADGSSVKRWELPLRFPQGLSWTPDGKGFAAWAVTPGRPEEWTTQLFDADTGRPGDRVPGRVTYAGATAFVLTDGDPSRPNVTAVRTDQRIEVAGRVVTDARRIGASAALREIPDATLPARIDQLQASPDGQLVAVVLQRVQPNGIASTALAVVRTSDGAVLWATPVAAPQNPVSDVSWAPTGALLQWTSVQRSGATQASRVVVVDPAAGGRTVLSVEGSVRAAGWSPDGAWAYVSRDTGLFAYPLAGGPAVRVSGIGVAVAAAKP